MRAMLGVTRARGEMELELTLRRMQHKEDKMQRERAGVMGVGVGGCFESSQTGCATCVRVRHAGHARWMMFGCI
jgi:hypothetical protein